MRACVARDRHLGKAVCHFCHGILITVDIAAALAAWSSTCVTAATASLTALKLVTKLVGAAHGACRHAHRATALLVGLAGHAHVVVRASFAVPLLRQLRHDLARKAKGVRRLILDQDVSFAAAAHCPV